MNTILRITKPEELPGEQSPGDIAPMEKDDFLAHSPDVHLALLRGGSLKGRCSLWWSAVPLLAGKKAGYIGHYAANTDADAETILSEACRMLAANGAAVAVGPVDGNTWRRYRLITRRGDEPSFFLEPDNPDTYPKHFESSGFSPIARYYSSLNEDISQDVSLPDGLRRRLENDGIIIRQLQPASFRDELATIHAISSAGFSNNFLYSPISREEFVGMYSKVLSHVRPELVLVAENNEGPVGFIFALPDILRVRNGHDDDTVILKSMAVLPEMSGLGIGALLMAQVSQNASRMGFRRSIHALMHENNRSRKMSMHYGREFRQYTLYSRGIS